MVVPSAVITGRWDVEIEFYSSKSHHTFFIEQQDGNWMLGSHKGDFSMREIAGTMEGDHVKLSSSDSHIADNIPFIFLGTVSGDKMNGQIYIGEYLMPDFLQ